MRISSDILSQNNCIHNRQSSKQVFFSLEVVNILLQKEAKPVKNASSLFYSRGHSELETGLFSYCPPWLVTSVATDRFRGIHALTQGRI